MQRSGRIYPSPVVREKRVGDSHRDFMVSNLDFIESCNAAHLPATKRQASKYRRKMGRAWNEGRPAMLAARSRESVVSHV